MIREYDEILTKDIVDKSMKDVGCVAPFLPWGKTENLTVCTSNTTGVTAYNLYSDQVYENKVDEVMFAVVDYGADVCSVCPSSGINTNSHLLFAPLSTTVCFFSILFWFILIIYYLLL